MPMSRVARVAVTGLGSTDVGGLTDHSETQQAIEIIAAADKG